MELKTIVQESVYKVFKNLQPEMIGTIERCKEAGLTKAEVKKQVKARAEKYGAKDGGNNLLVLVDYIYSKPTA